MDKLLFLSTVTAIVIAALTMLSTALRRKHQNQMHNRLLDKFDSAHDLSQFLQSPAGREYVSRLTDDVGNPVPSIVASVRTGVILFIVGGGFFVPSVRALDPGLPVSAIGTLVVFLGAGFLASSLVSFVLSRRFDLITRNSRER